MWQQTLLAYAPMFVLTAIATVSDVRSRRIPNLISLVLVTSGIIEAVLFRHGPSPVQAIQGMLVGFALSFPFFAIRALGAGDVKLLAGIGAWVGVGPILQIMLLSVLLAGGMVIVQSLFTGRSIAVLRNCFHIVVHFVCFQRLDSA